MPTNRQHFKAGQRVKQCCTIMGAAPCDTLGTVIARGGSIYSDPAKQMVWVRWDNDGHEEAEFKKYLDPRDAVRQDVGRGPQIEC